MIQHAKKADTEYATKVPLFLHLMNLFTRLQRDYKSAV